MEEKVIYNFDFCFSAAFTTEVISSYCLKFCKKSNLRRRNQAEDCAAAETHQKIYLSSFFQTGSRSTIVPFSAASSRASANTALSNLTKALYAYGAAAKAYNG